MIIEELDFDIFVKLFKGASDLIVGLTFNADVSAVTVLLDYTDYEWRVIRGAGEVRIYYSEKNGKPVWLGNIDLGELNSITIC